ncbi:tripartite tricarboxylate transporter TctB family protein [Salicibibacter cibi]|uniref:Tripartite tricarboxylate transporter TctB family protein n=1 Tax=Salicibibacter cibi TaxID=2743001 RepID=A0A7T6Z8N0_9BACI|nr:tripartite tricarboxylate transporter TctB family protein [Salicibibacter cibi]QQK78879.1 tripartite tricarboxylate transporter TctB family protein [Salicibibacter cibi]
MAASKLTPIIWIIFAITFIAVGLPLPFFEPGSVGLGPGGWPIIVLSMMLLAAMVLLVQETRSQDKQEETESDEEENMLDGEVIDANNHWYLLSGLVGYLILVPILGFFLISVLFILFVIRRMGSKNWLVNSGVSLITTALFVFMFGVLLNIPLPRGTGILNDLSFLLY